MRIRYSRNKRGKLVKQAEIYTRKEHRIPKKELDPEAVRIIYRLQSKGYDAYIVGGAVRDLLFGKIPKDFDIATNAYPSQIRKIFRNSRIIGRRFRLVHVYFKDNKIIEVATFRALESTSGDLVYGNIDEDVQRRDFTLNALFYNPRSEEIIDYVHGVKDIKKRVLRSVIPLNRTFREDPVRMIRAVKYAVSTECRIPGSISRRINRDVQLLYNVSSSRLSEELFKILSSGYSCKMMEEFQERKILPALLPAFSRKMKSDRDFTGRLYQSLKELDEGINSQKIDSRSLMLFSLINPYLKNHNVFSNSESRYLQKELIKVSKGCLKPLVVPNVEIDGLVKLIFADRDLRFPKRRHRRRQKRQKKGAKV